MESGEYCPGDNFSRGKCAMEMSGKVVLCGGMSGVVGEFSVGVIFHGGNVRG